MQARTNSFAVVAAALSPDPREATLLSRRAGFAGLQFDAQSATLNIPELSGTGRREFLQVLSSHGQQLTSLRAGAGRQGLGPGADVDRVLARIDAVMEAAAAMMTPPLVCVDLGPLPEPRPDAPPAVGDFALERAGLLVMPSGRTGAPSTGGGVVVAAAGPAVEPDPAFVSQVDGALSELGERADRYGVVLAFGSGLSSLAALARALRACRCPWFGVDLDPPAILGDEWSADDVIARLGTLVRHVRGRDAVAGARGRTTPAAVGRGSTDWGRLLSDLDGDGGYRGWVTVDPINMPDRAAAAAAGLGHLENLRRQGREAQAGS